MVPKALPSVLIVHTGGTLGMDPLASYEPDVDGRERLKGGGSFKGTLGPGMSFLWHDPLQVNFALNACNGMSHCQANCSSAQRLTCSC